MRKIKRSQLADGGGGHIVVASEREGKLNSLLDKMQRWVQQQPEWGDLMLLDRQTRRMVADLVAKELLKLPVRSTTAEPNRHMRREIIKVLTRRNK